MLTFNSESDFPLIGCGIDGETIARFSHLVDQDEPLPMVFTPGERDHARSSTSPAEAFCAAFCCKEALLKALGRPYDFTSCELLYNPDEGVQQPVLSPSDQILVHVTDCQVYFPRCGEGDLVAVVHLFGSA